MQSLLMLQAGDNPCYPCPGPLSSPWGCIGMLQCHADTVWDQGVALSAGQTGLAEHGGSVHPIQLCMYCVAPGAQADPSPCSIISKWRTFPLQVWCGPSIPFPGGAGRGVVAPGEWVHPRWWPGLSVVKLWEEAGALHQIPSLM